MTKRTKEVEPPAPQTDAVVGRELLEAYRHQNEEQADKLTEGMAVQYYDDGWRYGKVDEGGLPAADEKRYGQVRVKRPTTGTVWVEARDVKPLEQDWQPYFEWRKIR
jgi:hypothetical protein